MKEGIDMNELAVAVKLEIKKECIDEFIALASENAANILKEDGCLYFDIGVNGSTVLFYEVYKSDEAFNEHLNTAHYMEFDPVMKRCALSKEVSKYYIASVNK